MDANARRRRATYILLIFDVPGAHGPWSQGGAGTLGPHYFELARQPRQTVCNSAVLGV